MQRSRHLLPRWTAVSKDIVAKIDANPTAAGVDEAQKAFDARKDGLKTKMDAIKGRGRYAGKRRDEEEI